MTTYVLVHGAWHGGWCWYRIVARLERAGHHVLAPDLRSLGIDRSPLADVGLRDWTQQISALSRTAPDPVVLVGHSRGGIVLSEVAERIPDHVRTLVYVTAFLLPSGRSLQDAANDDPGSLVASAMVIADDHRSATIRSEAMRGTFYGQCGDEDVALAKSLLVPEPLAPFATSLNLSDTHFGRVPRVYVECRNDLAITHGAQRRMQQALPCRERITLDTDHSPFFSGPDALADCLLRFG